MINYEYYSTELSPIKSGSKNKVKLEIYFYFDDGGKIIRSSFSSLDKDEHFKGAAHRPRPGFIKDFDAFVKGKKPFDYSLLSIKGTAFQKAVWRQLLHISRGETKSYGEIAEKIHRPRAYRAVGSAVGSNPFAVIIPCHRVLHSGRKKVGKFGGGESIKKLLLENEGIFLPE